MTNLSIPVLQASEPLTEHIADRLAGLDILARSETKNPLYAERSGFLVC
jgi:hypothetical protein